VILAFTLFVGAVVVGFVGYDIYLHPADPEPVGKAIIEVTGAPDLAFSGSVGTIACPYGIEGQTPVALKVPYRRADTSPRPSSGPRTRQTPRRP
jgi:hypothetical protein